MTPENEEIVRRRQRGRSIVMAVLLGAFAILVFAIAVAKIKEGHHG